MRNKFFSKNKKGTDKILSVYWFAILFIVASGIFGMVYVFYNSPFDVREIEGRLMINRVSECISKQGLINPIFLSNIKTSDSSGKSTCSTNEECQKIIGEKIVSIVSAIKPELGISNIDESVRSEGVSENFECLVLQIATHESSMRHCVEFQKDGNPLYCDGNLEEVYKSTGDEKSYGIMQINTAVHDINPENFQEGIIYGVEKVLVQQYEENKAGRLFEPTQKYYSNWKAAIRGYNGWGLKGDNNYVENVIANREFVQTNFPEFCAPGTKIQSEQTKGISDACNLNFKSEFDANQYYVQVDFYNLKDFKTEIKEGKEIISSTLVKTFFDGNENLKSDCEIQEEKIFERQSRCTEGRFYSVDSENNPVIIKITSAVRKTEKNAV